MAVAHATKAKTKYLGAVLVGSFFLGLGVAIAVYLAWQSGVIAPGLHDMRSAVALFFCPPFILSVAAEGTTEFGLAVGLVAGTIVLANAFLYAGVAAGGYFVVTTFVSSGDRL